MRSDITKFVHQLLKSVVTPCDIIVDMTMGNGHDTLYLSTLASHVFSFDIQPLALEATKKKIASASNVTLILDNFININTYVNDYRGVIYNLGYLPNSDKKITTLAQDTLQSLETVLNSLPNLGFVIMTVYPGHDEGYEEHVVLQEYLTTLDHHLFSILEIKSKQAPERAPYIVYITKHM